MTNKTDASNETAGDARRSNAILCLAPNAAYQVTVLFEHIELGQVNRAVKQTNSLGGKGQNFAVATKEYYDKTDRVTLLQLAGGATGVQIEAMEEALGFDYITVHTDEPTRTCTTCIDARTGEMTEMVGVSGTVSREAEVQYESTAIALLQGVRPPRVLAVCGTFPPGLQAQAVARIVAAKMDGTLVFVDAVQDVHPVLATRCIDILKVNSGEVLSILADDPKYRGKAPHEVDLAAAAADLAHRYSIATVAVTDGPSTAYLVDTDGSSYGFTIPDLLGEQEKFLLQGGGESATNSEGKLVLNPLGAGDTCSAVMVNRLMDGLPMVDAFALGLAAASASCLVLMPNCVFDRKVMHRIRDRITITKVPK
ncbi:hypothetical protein EV175_000680 [Coemansia sp. RSA 1933]|nr:hypothetical protein EV175_000680 [Coemansia sp. RSA 1933]